MAKGQLAKLERDINAIEEAMAGALTRFGELGGAGNKVWTTFARITSGSWLWRFQARLRAVSNIVDLITDARKKANADLIKSIKLEGQLEDAMEGTAKKLKLLEDSEPLTAFEGIMGAIFDGDKVMKGLVARTGNWTDAVAKAKEMYGGMIKDGEKALEMNEKGLFKYYAGKAQSFMSSLAGKIEGTGFKDLGEGALNMAKMLGGEVGNTLKDTTGGFLKMAAGQGMGAITGAMSWMSGGNNNIDNPLKDWANIQAKSRLGKLQFSLFKKAFKIPWKAAGMLFKMGSKVMAGFVMYGVIAIMALMLIVGFFRKAWPAFTKIFAKFKPVFDVMVSGLMDILNGIWNLAVAIWEGRWWDAMKAFFFEIVWGLIKFASGAIVLIGGLLLSAALAVSVAIIRGIKGLLAKLPFFSSGGVTQGGISLVGEKGPELVSLPKGSRVSSHANSRGMGGNTINVHVNGRVGASDAEIRDIANKVAREINIRMNRQGTTMMGG